MAWGNIYTRRVKVFTLALVMYLDYKVNEFLYSFSFATEILNVKYNFFWEFM